MEAIKLPLPAGQTEELRIVSVWGERRLQGFADTGVFSIVTIGQTDPDDEPEAGSCGDDALEYTTVEIAGDLDFASFGSGGDPYNRHGQ
ncbi:MAG: hypothetical protein V3W02_00835 [Gammaproteobacteria bacterium]